MNQATLQLAIPLLLPGIEDVGHPGVTCLAEQLARRRGVDSVQVEGQNGRTQLCIHYDPRVVSDAQVRRWAERAGAQASQRYRREILHVTGMDCADCARSIEHIMRRVDGIL